LTPETDPSNPDKSARPLPSSYSEQRTPRLRHAAAGWTLVPKKGIQIFTIVPPAGGEFFACPIAKASAGACSGAKFFFFFQRPCPFRGFLFTSMDLRGFVSLAKTDSRLPLALQIDNPSPARAIGRNFLLLSCSFESV